LALLDHPTRGLEPSQAAQDFWGKFVGSGFLDCVNQQVWKFLRERKSPGARLPERPLPFRGFLHEYAKASWDATGGTAASAQWADGMTDHYDTVPHCAVTLCLTGDGDDRALYWVRHGARRHLHLDAGDIAILARGVLHGVERVARQEARMVVVLFY
jgi:hypothetical protein